MKPGIIGQLELHALDTLHDVRSLLEEGEKDQALPSCPVVAHKRRATPHLPAELLADGRGDVGEVPDQVVVRPVRRVVLIRALGAEEDVVEAVAGHGKLQGFDMRGLHGEEMALGCNKLVWREERSCGAVFGPDGGYGLVVVGTEGGRAADELLRGEYRSMLLVPDALLAAEGHEETVHAAPDLEGERHEREAWRSAVDVSELLRGRVKNVLTS